MRKSLPATTERNLLIRNKHCCCICQKDGHGKEINIHHIDGDNGNNAISNLAVLCLVHASQADAGLAKGKLGSGKKLKPDAVAEYKNQWEKRIQEENTIPKKKIPTYRKRQLGFFFYNEIQRIKHEIIALDEINPNDKTIKLKFAFLNSLVMEEYVYDIKVRKYLMEAYAYLAFIAAESGVPLVKALTDAMDHLLITVDSEYTDVSSEDIHYLRASIDALDMLGSNVASYNTNPATLKIVCAMLGKIGMISYEFKIVSEMQRVVRTMNKIKKSCLDFRTATKAATDKQQQLRQKIVEREILRLNRGMASSQ